MKHIEYTDKQIKQNNIRTMKEGLFSNLEKDQLNELTDKYFRDENDNLYCAYSGEIIKNKKDLALEHIIPVNRGGSSVIFNVSPALKSINSSKHDNDLLTWWKEQDFYDIDRLRNLTMYMLEAYDKFFNETSIEIDEEDLQEIEENIDELKKDEYDKQKKTKEQKLEQIDYRHQLKVLIDELRENGITLSNIDKDNKYGIDYRQLYNNILSSNYFEDIKERELYQNIIFKHLKKYAEDRKYIIASNLNYKDIYEHIDKLLKENNTKEEYKETMIDYIIESRIIYLTNTVSRKTSSTDIGVLETVIDMPELLYKPLPEFTEEYIEQIKDNIPMNKYIRFEYLIEFYEEEGRWPKATEQYKGKTIGTFLKNIKSGQTNLDDKQNNKLLELDPNVLNIKDVEGEKNEKFSLLLEFYEEEGRWPKQKEQYKGETIGTFLRNIKRGKTSLDDKQNNKLKELDPNVLNIKDIEGEKNEKFSLLLEFYEENGRWPKHAETYQGENIGIFLRNIKSGQTNLDDKQNNKLLELDPNVLEDPRKVEINRKYDLLLEFYQEKGRWPKQSDQYKGENLGRFLNSIKIGDTSLSDEQKKKLLELDPNVLEDPRKVEINRKYDLLLEFYDENGRWPKQKEQYKGENLGIFLSSIKIGATNLDDKQKKKLLELDPTLVIKEKELKKKIKDVKNLKKEQTEEELVELPPDNIRKVL